MLFARTICYHNLHAGYKTIKLDFLTFANIPSKIASPNVKFRNLCECVVTHLARNLNFFPTGRSLHASSVLGSAGAQRSASAGADPVPEMPPCDFKPAEYQVEPRTWWVGLVSLDLVKGTYELTAEEGYI